MSLTQKVRLTLDDGREIETTYDGRDIRAWEAETGKSALTQSMDVTMLTKLGHYAAVRRGDINGDLKTYGAFDKVCVWAEGMADDEKPPGPTKPASRPTRKRAGGGSSAPSP